MTLLDVGANAEARREHLVQFAYMGAALASSVLGVERPRVGLLSNGEESGRGSALVLETHAALAERSDREGAGFLEFVGNVEGDDVVAGRADVIVTDGFTGNVALKLIEGVSQTILGAIRTAARSSLRGQAGGLLLRGALGGFREEIDPETPGGAYLLGLRRLGVVPHGRFTRRGFAQAILRADRGAQGGSRRRDPACARGGRALSDAHPCPRSPLASPVHERPHPRAGVRADPRPPGGRAGPGCRT